MKPQGIAKKTVSGVVAFALGASVVLTPQANALPAQFTSPPGVTTNPQQGACTVALAINTTSVSPGRAFVQGQSGVTVGVGLDRDNKQFTPWVTLDPQGERIFNSATANITVANESQKPVTHSYNVKTLGKGKHQAGVLDNGENASFNVTDLAPTDAGQFSLAQGINQVARAQLGVDAEASKAQTWAWQVSSPTVVAQERTRVSPEIVVDVAPWPMESEDCAPLTPSDKKSQPIIADGAEYNTGITVANGSQSDYARLTGNVSIAGNKVNGAKVRVDASGKVFVTLPKGATGAEDNNKPAKVDVELLAQPREATKKSKYESYNKAQVLRVVDNHGVVNEKSALFTGSVPVQKFAPAYNSPNMVRPGQSINVTLKTQPGNVRGKAVGATYAVTNAPNGWTAKPAKDGTLNVTAPKGAKHGDTATFTVKVTYADGSADTITTDVKVQDINANVYTPGYGEVYGKVNTEVSLEQNNKQLPKNTTFTITPNQDLGDWVPKVDGATGKITVTIPGSANPGDQKTILVDAKYPDNSVDSNVPGKVIVLNEPSYGEVTGKPGENVELNHTGKVVGGSTFTITPNQDLGDWAPKVDGTTGKITVTIPGSATDGDEKIISIDVKDPKSGKNDTVDAKVIVKDDQKQPEVPSTPAPKDNTIVIVVPKGPDSKVEIGENPIIPDGSTPPVVTPGTGNITLTIPNDVKPGTKITIPVVITNPDGSKETREITVEVPDFPKASGNSNGGNVLIVNPGGDDGGLKLPEGWTYTKEGDNIIINVPGGTKPGDYNITVPGPNNTNVDVKVTVPSTGQAGSQGSSDALNKCVENAIASPLFYLLPVGLLAAAAGNLAAPYMAEVNNQLNSLARQFNANINFGVGENAWNSNNFSQFDEIGRQFAAFMNDPNMRELGMIAIGLVGALATAGLLYDWCTHEPGEAVTSVGSAKGEGSSQENAEETASAEE